MLRSEMVTEKNYKKFLELERPKSKSLLFQVTVNLGKVISQFLFLSYRGNIN